MTNQEILQQVFNEMPNEFYAIDVVIRLNKFGYYITDNNTDNFWKFLDERSETIDKNARRKKVNWIRAIDPYKHIKIGTMLVAKVECSGSLIISKEYRVNGIASDVFYINSETHVSHRFTFKNVNNYFTTKPEEVDPQWVNVHIDYYNKLVDIERKYNQLMKSFKEVEG